jgi:hypothetical protein
MELLALWLWLWLCRPLAYLATGGEPPIAMTCHARSALRRLSLEILPLDADPAPGTQAAVQLVVVTRAVGRIVQDVELQLLRRERGSAGGADETLFVVAAGQSSVGGGEELALDGEGACFARAAIAVFVPRDR